MNLLHPLLLAGIAAVGLPIVLHMIRRYTHHRVTFSSLMFLRTTMPRFRSRSRLEHIPLLLVRCLVLCLLAFALSRPFFARPVGINENRPGKRVVVLLDTSASMRRAGLWSQAIDEARSVFEETDPTDHVCVMTFDRSTQTLVGFEQWDSIDTGRRAQTSLQSLSELSPGWKSTDLGRALVTAAEGIEDEEVNDSERNVDVRQIVLISDLPKGCDLDALLAYEWPAHLQVVVRTVGCPATTNASLQAVVNHDPLISSRVDRRPEVRVTNSSDATTERFRLAWRHGVSSETSDETMDVYVPAGHSIVTSAPAGPNVPATTELVLAGDDHEFDNVLYLAPHLRQQINILYVGPDDPNDTQAMLYYVRQAFAADDDRISHVSARPGRETIEPADVDNAHLIVVGDGLSRENLLILHRYVESGGTILLVAKSAEMATTVSGLANITNIEIQEVDAPEYVMLGAMQFQHPLLTLLSDPRYSDFTQIHYWKYRRLNGLDHPRMRVLARYDNNDPAWLEIPVGGGSLLIWTSGWHPSDSDLALSSKFVPLLYSALEYGGVYVGHEKQYFVTDAVPLPNNTRSRSAEVGIRRPDGSIVPLRAGQMTFAQTDMPGIYTLATTEREPLFAVNLPPSESRTEPMPIEELERLGPVLKPTREIMLMSDQKSARQNSLSEMESQQKLWRWLILATLATILIEIWLSGWLTRPNPTPEGERT